MMQIATFVLFAFAAGIPPALANFDVYRATYDVESDNQIDGFQVYQNEATCDEAEEAFTWELGGDVSGSIGFRCEGGDNCEFPSQITELEMHFGNGIHFTIYEEQGWNLIGLDGAVYGECFPFPGDDFNCVHEGGGDNSENINIIGARYFRCLTDRYDAAALNQAGRDSEQINHPM